jgi:hypothetical protein
MLVGIKSCPFCGILPVKAARALILKFIAVLFICAVFAAVCFWPARAAAVNKDGAGSVMKLSDIKVGMKGVGRTVVSGTLIEEFDVEVLGILKNNKLDEALQISGSSILVRVSGDVILKSGGIAAGMSGSPVYIDNKLAGAIASGWIMTDHTIGLMTPVEEMLGLFKYINNKKNKVNVNEMIQRDAMLFMDKSSPLKGYKGVVIDEGNIDGAGLASYSRRGYMVFKNAATPVMVSGLNGRNYGRLRTAMKKSGNNIDLINSQRDIKGASGDFEIKDLKPGHAIALQLVRGDINITAIGTLTYLKDNKFLAFAHSFMKKGDCSFFFAPADIYYCFYSQEMPFKIGAPGKLTGSVLVDRNEGIAGLIGLLPKVASVRAAVADLDNGVSREFCSQLVRDAAMFTQLLQAVLTQAVDEGINRQGEGFARITYKITGRSEKSGEFVISRRNYYYDMHDIASVAIDEILNVANAIAMNQFEKADIYDIDVKFEISAQSPCARVTQASVNSNLYEKGSSVEVSVTVEGDYKRPFTETFDVAVPLNIRDGEYTLKISSVDYTAGHMAAQDFELSSKNPDSLELCAPKNAVSFKDLIRILNNAEKNNQIKVEFEPVFASAAPAVTSAGGAETGAKSPAKSKESKKYRETPSLDIDGANKDRLNREKSLKSSATSVSRPAGAAAFGAAALPARGGRVTEMISGLKSQYYANNPTPAEENYKFYKSFEFLFYPFNAQFSITIGESVREGGLPATDEFSDENQSFDDMIND